MAYTVPVGAILELSIRAKMELQDIMTVLHYRLSSTSPLGDGAAALVAILDQVAGAGQLKDKWLDCVASAVTNTKVVAQWITPERYGFRETQTLPATGQLVGNPMPVNAAAAITRRAEGAGRLNVATIHMPGLTKDAVVNGLITDAQQALYMTFGSATLDNIILLTPALTLTPVIFHRASPPLSPRPLNVSIQPTARVMRRRTVGLGS